MLLIGERPGLATNESLSAYLAFRPRPGHTDAQRNLISNIHARGVPPLVAAERIAIAIRRLMQAQAQRRGNRRDDPGAASPAAAKWIILIP